MNMSRRPLISVIVLLMSVLLLVAVSCKSGVGSVNINVNAAAQKVVNTAQGIVSEEAKERVSKEAAVAAAKSVYVAQEAQGVDFSNGPCLSDSLLPDWVADIAHDPRIAIDDDPRYQCAAYREGRAHHFVELDTEGKLIRAE